MDRWIDNLSAGERAELTDAGRLGNSRFDGPPDDKARAELARHGPEEELAESRQWVGDDFGLPCKTCGALYRFHITPDDDIGLVLCPD